MTRRWSRWLARTGFRRRDLLLAPSLGVIAAVIVDMMRHPAKPGVISWAALTVSAGAIAVYLGLLVWDRRRLPVPGKGRSEGAGGRATL